MTEANVTAAKSEAGAVPENWKPHIVALVCNWCSYAGADMAGTTRREYPANVRMMRFPCTGRMSPLMILRAFEQGADGVLVSGCHPGDCHYVQGNLVARRRDKPGFIVAYVLVLDVPTGIGGVEIVVVPLIARRERFRHCVLVHVAGTVHNIVLEMGVA